MTASGAQRNDRYGFTHTNAEARAQKVEHIERAIRVNGGVHGDDAKWMLNEYHRLTSENDALRGLVRWAAPWIDNEIAHSGAVLTDAEMAVYGQVHSAEGTR